MAGGPGQSYVLAVADNEATNSVGGPASGAGAEPLGVLAGGGLGALAPRVYDWQCRMLAEPEAAEWERYVLFRRSRTDPEDGRQAYLVYAAQRCSLETLVRVAGTRWCIESGFEVAQQEVVLDTYEVYSATGRDRHMTLALLAALRATTLPAEVPGPKKVHEQPGGFQAVPRAGVSLSLETVRRLLWHLWLRIVPTTDHILAWLDGKRSHAWTAPCCHYRRRAQASTLQL